MFSIRLRVREEIKTVVSPSETVTLIIRQSLWHSISPSTLVLTDRRVVIIHHSFWGLYTKINLINPTEINVVQHINVKSIALGRGLLFGTARLRLIGFVEPTPQVDYEWDMSGMWINDALRVMTEIGRLIEERSKIQDSKISPTNAMESLDEDANTRRSEMALNETHKATVIQKAASVHVDGEERAKGAVLRRVPDEETAEMPVAYAIKNNKVVAAERVEFPKQGSKVYGRAFGIAIMVIGLLGMLYSLGYNPIPFLKLEAYFNLASSTFLMIIGVILTKLA